MKQIKELIIMNLFTLISKISGFIRQILLVQIFGIGYSLDSFVLASSLIVFVNGLFATGINNVFIPIYLEAENKKEQKKFFNTILLIIMMFSCFLMVTFYLNLDNILKLYIGNSDIQKIIYLEKITKVLLPSIFFYLIAELLSSNLQANQNFSKISYINFIMNLITIFYLLMFSQYKIIGYAYATTIAEIIRVLIFTFLNRKYFFGIKIFYNENNSKLWFKIKLFFKGIFPIILGSGITQINFMIDFVFASRLSVGVLSKLDNVNKLNQLIISTFILNYLVWTFPKIININNNFKDKLLDNIKGHMIVIIIFSLFVINIFNLLGKDILYILFGNKIYEKELINMYKMLKISSITILLIGIRELLFKIIYLKKKNSKIMIINFLTVVTNISFNFLLVNIYQEIGLILATTISFIINIFSSICLLKKEIKIFNEELLKKIFLIFMINTFIYLILIILEKYILLKSFYKLIIFGGISFILYLICLYLFGIYEYLNEKIEIK